MRRIASCDVLNVKIGPTGASVEARKKRKSEVNIRRFWVYIWRICGKKPLRGLTPNFAWGRCLRHNHVFQIW